MNEKKWVFLELQGAGDEGPNVGAGDHFKGAKLSSLVREMVQNSIDAEVDENKVVKVAMNLKTVKAKSFNGFYGIWDHVQACYEFQKRVSKTNRTWEERWKSAIDKHKNKEDVSILCFHDSNTKGLYGPIDGKEEGAFYALKGQGISNKQNQGSGGSFGHGAVSALLYSATRSVFYYTKVNEEPRERFFGKTILQTHEHPNKENKPKTRAQGYYGYNNENISPLTDKDIPSWASKFRNEVSPGEGCSVYIPYTNYNRGLTDATIIALIANFYMAFKESKLEAKIDYININYKNIDMVYEKYKNKFNKDTNKFDDHIDTNYIEECFKSIETVKNPTVKRVSNIPNFGKIRWYLRLTDDINWRKVGVSRKLGMLITREAKQLDRFTGFKPFDMFVSVRGKDANETLKELENPQHSAFELNRIDDLPDDRRNKIKKSYKKFTDGVRNILKEYAKSETSQEETVDEAAELFGELTDTSDDSKNDERGLEITISNAPLISTKPKSGSKKSSGKIGKGAGLQGGLGVKKKPGGNNKGEYETVVAGDGPFAGRKPGKNFDMNNLRLGNISPEGKHVTLYFDPPKKGKFFLKLKKKGEQNGMTEILKFDNKKNKEIEIAKKTRTKIDLIMSEDISNFVLEGELNEIKD